MKRKPWLPGSALRAWPPVSGAVAIEFDLRDGAVRSVDKTTLGTAGAAVVERRCRNRIRRFTGSVIGARRVVIPLVRAAIAVGVVLAPHEDLLLVELRAVEPAVAFGRYLDAAQNTGGFVERL